MIALTRVSKSHKKCVQGSRLDKALEPLLVHLEKMIGSNKHQDCRKVFAPVSKRECTCLSRYNENDEEDELSMEVHPCSQSLSEVDPRYNLYYDEWSTTIKCKRMISIFFLSSCPTCGWNFILTTWPIHRRCLMESVLRMTGVWDSLIFSKTPDAVHWH